MAGPTNNTNYQWIKDEKLSEGSQTCIVCHFFFFETKFQNWAKLQSFSLSLYEPKVWNTLGDTLLQHVTMTNHWLCTGQATSCVTRCNNKPLYMHWRVFVKIFVLAREFCHWKNHIWFEFVWLVAATKFCCADKSCHKILQYTQRNLSLRCVAAIMLVQLVT